MSTAPSYLKWGKPSEDYRINFAQWKAIVASIPITLDPYPLDESIEIRGFYGAEPHRIEWLRPEFWRESREPAAATASR